MDRPDFWELQRTLGFEFSRYILAHPEMDEQIPEGAMIVFNIEDNPEFNEWTLRTAQEQQEPGQPIVVVTIKELVPVTASRLVDPKIKLVSSI